MGGIGVISAQDDDAAAAASTSFKLKRKSALASKLKSSISKHLRHSYSHDRVLAEYITVLVCNGKNQEQARHDLEAFLGQRTQEFVSWLWDLLLKYVYQSNKDICLLSDAKNVNITTPCAKDSKINKLKDFQSHGHDSSTMDAFVIKDDQMRQLPTTSDPNFCNVNHGQLAEDFEQVRSFSSPSSEINSKKVLSRSCKTERHGKIGASENVLYNSLANESLRKESSSNAKQNSHCVDKATKQIVPGSCNMLFNQLIPRREPAFRNPQPSTSGKCLLPRSVHAESHQKEKHCISVWDRLGKPCDGVPSGVKTVELCDGSGTVYLKQELLNQHKAVLPVLNSELRGSMTGGVTGRGNIQPESRKLERPTRTMHEAHAANNIRRKRHFREICTDQDALAGCSRKELQCLDFSQFSKRSNMIKEDSKATPNLISEVLDVKQKLHKIELEMSKLRSKQVEMEKDGKSNLLSRSDGKIHAEEDTKMRTVFVTNVKYILQQQMEALSLYFAKCGVVENVVILTDKTTGQRKGSAYVAFASKDSAEKAVALSGATFFSRTLKVSRKAESTSAMAQLAGKPSRALSSRINKKAVVKMPYSSSSHLQWRRDSSTSEPSASANEE